MQEYVTFSQRLHNGWREVEKVLMVLTGPILILASFIQTFDVFANEAISTRYPGITLVWAAARALAVVFWIKISLDLFQDAHDRGNSGFWWFVLFLLMAMVEVQSGALFLSKQYPDLGQLPFVNIPAMYWAAEQFTLGVILIGAHSFLHHKPAGSPAPTPAVTVAAPVAYTAYTPEEPPQGPRGGGRRAPAQQVIKLVGPTRQTARRRDSGSTSAQTEAQVNRVVKMILADPKTSLTDIEETLDVTRSSAVAYRNKARDIIKQHYADAM